MILKYLVWGIMMKTRKIYEGQKNSVYRIAKEINVKPATIYRYAENEKYVNKMSAEIIFKMAEVEDIDPKELWLKMKENARNNYYGI